MKELNLYALYVNTRGPYAYTKSGRGTWYVCETSKKNAKKALQEHFNKEKLNGTPDDINRIPMNQLELDTNILPRRTCMLAASYRLLLDQKYNQGVYEFTPKKSEKGIILHKINRPSQEYRNINIPGAHGTKDIPEYREDCGNLQDIKGVTYNGNPLSYDNLDNICNNLSDDFER